MTCTDFERQMLLDASGELSLALRPALHAHVAGCSRCQEFEADSRALQHTFREFPTAGIKMPPEAFIHRIHSAAEGRAVIRYHLFPRPAQWLAIAATLLLALGIWHVATRPSLGVLPRDTRLVRIADVSALLAALTEAENELSGNFETQDTHSDLKSLAHQLLILQDMNVEMPEDLAENLTPPEASRPTSLQWRSSPSDPATGRV